MGFLNIIYLIKKHNHPPHHPPNTQDKTRDEDPREAILRHAEAAERDPRWVTPAYATTQPQPVFDLTPDDDDDDGAPKKAKFDPNLRQAFL
jgi:hypothetical protein